MSAGGSGLQAPFVGADALEGAAGDPMDIQGDDPEQQEEQQQRTDTEQQVISERSDWQTVGRLKVTPQEAYAQLLQQKKNCRASYWKVGGSAAPAGQSAGSSAHFRQAAHNSAACVRLCA
jgi:hypothetical protein